MKKTNYVMNASGKMINPFDLKTEDFDPKIIAQTLSRVCRFWGQTSKFYSVAQHCLAMTMLFEDIELQKWALIHEVFEGLTGMDIPTPIKYSQGMKAYREAEKKALLQAAEIFGISPPIPKEIEIADKRMMVTEALLYMNSQNFDWKTIAKPYEHKEILEFIELPLNIENARINFLMKWNELFNNKTSTNTHKSCSCNSCNNEGCKNKK